MQSIFILNVVSTMKYGSVVWMCNNHLAYMLNPQMMCRIVNEVMYEWAINIDFYFYQILTAFNNKHWLLLLPNTDCLQQLFDDLSYWFITTKCACHLPSSMTVHIKPMAIQCWSILCSLCSHLSSSVCLLSFFVLIIVLSILLQITLDPFLVSLCYS